MAVWIDKTGQGVVIELLREKIKKERKQDAQRKQRESEREGASMKMEDRSCLIETASLNRSVVIVVSNF